MFFISNLFYSFHLNSYLCIKAFSECIERLKQEILNIEPKYDNTVVNLTKKMTEENLKNKNGNENVTNWNESDIEKWFSEEAINMLILEDLRPCDGKILNQLFEILTTSPDFFYSALTAKNKINLRDVAVFTYKLKKLFKN